MVSKHQQHLNLIVNKLKQLKELDTHLEIFGASAHKYQLSEGLSIAEIEAYERNNKINLPADYRLFLQTLGGSKAGPFYGLEDFQTAEDNTFTKPAQPFPFDSDSIPILDQMRIEQYEDLLEQHEGQEDEEEYYAQLDDYISAVHAQATQGIIFLCTEGCNMHNILVINGKLSGTVWWFNFADHIGVLPLLCPCTKQPLTFLDWYELWLDRSLAHFTKGAKELTSYNELIDPSKV